MLRAIATKVEVPSTRGGTPMSARCPLPSGTNRSRMRPNASVLVASFQRCDGGTGTKSSNERRVRIDSGRNR